VSRRAAKERAALSALAACALLGAAACARPAATQPRGPVRIVLKHQPLFGDPTPFAALLERFRRDNPGIALEDEALPGGSDAARQFYLTSLEGKADDFDVLGIDVIWTPEFARAGWIADLSAAFPPEKLRREFLPAAAEAVILDGRSWAVPWYLDVGLLYYRTDLVPRAPRTYDELASFARAAQARDPALAGLLWQGRQYEGLSCNAFEAIWGHEGTAATPRPENTATPRPENTATLRVDTPAARAGLEWLRSTIASGLSPRSVASASEEETRRVFQDGRAVFLRNWPYVWAEVQREGSAVRGKVAWTTLPTTSGAPGAGALGGWQLAVNAHSPPWRRAAAERLIAHLTSLDSAVALALAYSRNPSRRDAYDDPRVRSGAPFIAALLPAALAARPRPVSPIYDLAADTLQGELSAAIIGLRSPAEALARAQLGIDRLEASR
jgi:multiple sugar transport system substrate-binding protein